MYSVFLILQEFKFCKMVDKSKTLKSLNLEMTTVKELHVWFNDDSYLLVTGKEAEDATIDLLKYAMRGTPLFVSLAENKYYASTSISTFKVVEEEQ